MISSKVEKAFNDQINAELYSAYLYLSMAAYFDSENLAGMAQWMKVQAKEEVEHAMKFYAHINDRGGTVVMKAIDGPKTKWASPLAVFEEGYKHEQKVTGLINKLVALAQSEKDTASSVFLQWFVTEQCGGRGQCRPDSADPEEGEGCAASHIHAGPRTREERSGLVPTHGGILWGHTITPTSCSRLRNR